MRRRNFTRDELLEIIRTFYKETRRLPKSKEIGNKNYQLIRKYFGDYNVACQLAITNDLSDNPELLKDVLTNELKVFFRRYKAYPAVEDFGNGDLSPLDKYCQAFHCSSWEVLKKYLGLDTVAVAKFIPVLQQNTDFSLVKMLQCAYKNQEKPLEFFAQKLGIQSVVLQDYFAGDRSVLNAGHLEQLFELLDIKCEPRKSKYTNSMLLEEIASFYQKNKRYPLAKELKSYITVINRFGSLQNAFQKAGLLLRS